MITRDELEQQHKQNQETLDIAEEYQRLTGFYPTAILMAGRKGNSILFNKINFIARSIDDVKQMIDCLKPTEDFILRHNGITVQTCSPFLIEVWGKINTILFMHNENVISVSISFNNSSVPLFGKRFKVKSKVFDNYYLYCDDKGKSDSFINSILQL